MPELLQDQITGRPDEVALRDDDGALTWRQLGERVNRWAGLLSGSGLAGGDRVACVLGNRRETFVVLLACLHSGLTVVPVNWHLTAPEVAHIVADSGARAVVVEPTHVPTVSAALLGVAGVATRVVLGEAAIGDFRPAEPMLRSASPAEPAGQTTGSFMLYTSGTTGSPKGVDNGLFRLGAPFSRAHRTMRYAQSILGVPADGRVLLDGPCYHSSQLFFSLLPLLLGSTLVVRGRFDPAETLRVIDRERITAAHLVPTQLVRLLRVDEPARAAFSGASLRMVWHGSGPCPIGAKRRMIAWWGPVFTEYYGATEGGAVTMIDSREWLRRPGSVGRALPSYDLGIVDDGGEALPPGRIGRVYVRRRGGGGRSFGYHNAPEKTDAAHLPSGAFTFGDLGRLDDAGYLHLTGRRQDLVVSGGVNVYPAEVEAVLVRHPDVRDAVVLGVPDEEFGERVVAVVEAAAGAPVDLAVALDLHCRRSLAGFKVPRVYHRLDALPREATGKLRQDVVRRMVDDAARSAKRAA